MYDGNFWNGGCLNSDHGHPVPYTFEDHIRANVDLAARIHAKYPRVLIEMHDMIAGGSPIRHTPLYYTYGLPGSWDENWGDDRARTIEGSIGLAEIGLDPGRAYVFDQTWVRCADGKLVVKAALGPWGAKMASAVGR